MDYFAKNFLEINDLLGQENSEKLFCEKSFKNIENYFGKRILKNLRK